MTPCSASSPVEKRGRITIPSEVRKRLSLGLKDRVRFNVAGGGVPIERAESVLEQHFMILPPLDPPRTWAEIRAEVHDERALRQMQIIAQADAAA